ncbi:hypothetical protein KKF34_17665 [Myxococcota bacterium]|nr:hypothetical protein [Myxococcota bacterium]MBU1382375.1 hypothetical protein [Myxococcota bacterium]MBU1498711.1 hypothetical protein [Myxococcota bacterium]
MKISAAAFLVFFLMSACNLPGKKTTSESSTNDQSKPSNQTPNQGISLSKILDFYDEVQSVESKFQTEIIVDGNSQGTSEGTYTYNRGSSRWVYYKNDKVIRIVECEPDRAIVKVPVKSKKNPEKIVQEKKSKFPCVMQAIVHYSGAFSGNTLTRKENIYTVDKHDAAARHIIQVTHKKSGMTIIYKFLDIKFTPMPGKSLPAPVKTEEKPAPSTDKAPVGVTKPANKEIKKTEEEEPPL